ncbi:MAG: PadR family transcriptional regulator [Candidatus Heimdallarchaeaceae archaeon]
MNGIKRDNTDKDLDWKELNIMSLLALKKETHKQEIIQEIKQRFPSLRNKPNSSFYLIFDRLQKKGLITVQKIVGKGHKAFISLTNMGLKQIHSALHWSFQLLAPTLIQTFINNILTECQPFFSCDPSSKIAFIGPSLILSDDTFLSSCNRCSHKRDQMRYFLKMPYNRDVNLSDYETISCEPDDIPIKNEYFDNALSILTLSLLKNQEQRTLFLQELKRTLVSRGKIFLVELKQFRSSIYKVISSVTDIFTMLFSNNSNRLCHFELDELLNLIYQTFPQSTITTLDYTESIFIKIQL